MERRSLPFGKKLLARNFVVLKYTKALKKSELREARNMQGIPAEVQKHLQRGGLPYIKVSTLAENWSVEFVCGSTMYNYIDTRQLSESKDRFDDDSIDALHNLFVLMLADCTILGDAEYLEAKGKLLKEYMERHKAADIDKAADDKILDEMKSESEAKDAISEIKDKIEKGLEDGE